MLYWSSKYCAAKVKQLPLIKLFVAEGEIVEAGQTLCIVEAMKMENALIAEKRCKIEKLFSGEGDILSVDATIMTFAAAD